MLLLCMLWLLLDYLDEMKYMLYAIYSQTNFDVLW